jgi:S1-C subfamily serine protease
MTSEPNPETRPIDVQHYGPAPAHETQEHQRDWHAAPSWSSRPPTPPPQPPRRAGPGAGLVVALALVVGAASGGVSAFAVSNLVQQEPAPAATSDDTGEPDTADRISDVRIDESSAVIEAAQQVGPAVVSIRTRQGGIIAAEGTGSGVIFDPDGWILTNRHVVEDANELVVQLNDGRELAATVYGVDTYTDLAIIKVEPDEALPVAPIGTSGDLEPGQLAIAIGNPLGQYANTVTTGVVSGLGRNILAGDVTQSSSDQLNDLIQTDAAINPGNSGGPLVNSAGQVIGINTAVSTSAQGIGFAIPIDVAKPIMDQALAGEELTRPWIGVYYVAVTPSLAQELGLPVDAGALIRSADGSQPAVFADGPAAAAGLREGDIIVAVDGERIDEGSDLASLLLPHAAGETVTLRILRDGDSAQEVQVTLGERPADP